jgi:endonuclease YncB( thermonuclease family)
MIKGTVLSFLAILVSNPTYAGTVTMVDKLNKQNIYRSTITYIVDGDTFHTQRDKIRLWGMNTPEKNKPYYKAAQQALQNLIQDNNVTCHKRDIDPYKRIVAKCYVGDIDIGRSLVQQGYAADYRYFSRGYYAKEQKAAKKARIGIWSK